MIKEFVYECKRIQQDGRAMRVIHGEIVPHHDKLGERLGEIFISFSMASH